MELTREQISRQDIVDNACYALMLELAKGSDLPWDIEHISTVREAIQSVLVEKLHIMSEIEFYPYIDAPDLQLPESICEDGSIAV